MEALDLQLAILDVEVLDEVLEDIAALCHQLGGLLVSEHLMHELVRPLEVGEQKDEHLLGVPRNLNQVDLAVNLMEVPVQNLSLKVDTKLVVPNVHGWWSLLGHDVDLVLTTEAVLTVIMVRRVVVNTTNKGGVPSPAALAGHGSS